MPPIEENNDFLKQKSQVNNNDPAKKLDLKQGQQQNNTITKSKSLDNRWADKIKQGINLTEDIKKLIIKKYDFVKNELLNKKIIKDEKQFSDYKQYKTLSDYHKYCLEATNYWLIMNDNKFINVPIEDTHFWFYFDERCFNLCVNFQKVKKQNKDELDKRNNSFKTKSEIELSPVVNETENKSIVENIIIKSEPLIETKMPIEENKDFLKEKQEHTAYVKKEVEIKKEASTENEMPDAKKNTPEPKNKKTNKKNNNNNNEQQASLF